MNLAAAPDAASGSTPDEDRMPDGAFTVDEVGTGNRVSLTPFDLAFLDGPPKYDTDEEEWSLRPEEAAAPVWVPSEERRAAARRLFFLIGGSAVLVLVLALVRLSWRAAFG
jgi:hypothetical protein